ncbi:hypothetical protein LEP1GSC037_5314 [Leptospira interrogans str. 2006001854]|uniref:Uncharacterized protein n=1 Tax=Leptospira interrogans str. 2006001854 TaxID=1001590 RepID=M6G809_LEPIR|nr:hypothetical protein LEP1GSC037_5314 [Leptospira interrogans str. 2006001854]
MRPKRSFKLKRLASMGARQIVFYNKLNSEKDFVSSIC